MRVLIANQQYGSIQERKSCRKVVLREHGKDKKTNLTSTWEPCLNDTRVTMHRELA